MMDREEYSCDEEDWEHYDNLTSVSQNVNTVSGAQCPLWSPQGETYYQHEDSQCQGEGLSGQHHDNEELSTFSVPHPAGTSASTSVTRVSLAGENIETSSQMARSIVSSLFRRMPGPESDTHVSSPASDLGSHMSTHISSQSRGRRPHVDQIEELEEIETKSDKVIGTKSLDGSGKKMLADINLETFSDDESELSETAKKLEYLSQDEQSFSKRINEWIKTVSIRDEMDTIKKNYDSIVHKNDEDNDTVPTNSPSMESKSVVEKTNYEQSEVSEFQDDQPSGLTSPAPVLMVSNFTDVSDDQAETDTEDFEELRKKFQAERNSFVPSSIIPTVALQSFEQGFANVQKSNGNLLFENGMGRNKRMTNSPISYPRSVTKNYHFKVLETTEQKMKILRDGTRQVDTTHTREQSENVYDGESFWMRCSVILKVLLVIILCSVLVTGYFYRFYEGFELYCHLSHSHDSIEEGKVSIEL